MLQILVPGRESFNEQTQEFIVTKDQSLRLEHSLVSISKWEAKWQKPFLDNNKKTVSENIDYIKCMTLTQNVDPNVYYCLTSSNMQDVMDYIDSPMSATWFSNQSYIAGGRNGEVVTSELIYYWMVQFQIPFECQKWHLNRLLTLIRICSIKNQPPKQMSKNAILKQNTALNKARRAKTRSKG